jgi:hypothetical protein
MNRILIGLISFLLFTFCCGFQTSDEPVCDSKSLKEKARKTMDPYKYDSAKMTKIAYKAKESLKEVEVPLFLGEKYRFVFNTETISKPVIINVYNKDKEARNRKLLWTSKDDPATLKEHIFEHTHAMKVFVDYAIPPTDSTAAPGCILFMLGYK